MHTTIGLNRALTRAILTLTFLLAACAGRLYAQTAERPKPGPEHQKLAVWVGDWAYEGESKATPLGPAGEIKGTESSRLILDGFVWEDNWRDEPMGGHAGRGLILMRYDPEKQAFVDYWFGNDGSFSSTIHTVKGNVWTGLGTQTDAKGRRYQAKYVRTLAADAKTIHTVAAYSADNGKTWMPWWEITGKKANP